MEHPPRLSRLERVLYAVPLIGWMLKDVVHGDPDNVYWFIFTLGALWIMAIMAFGYPAIILPALAAVPVAFLTLVLISRG